MDYSNMLLDLRGEPREYSGLMELTGSEVGPLFSALRIGHDYTVRANVVQIRIDIKNKIKSDSKLRVRAMTLDTSSTFKITKFTFQIID